MLKKGGSAIFFDAFLILIRALDDTIDPKELTVDSIVYFLQSWNYPGCLIKNIFQPIGAMHTWNNCLAILDFMA